MTLAMIFATAYLLGSIPTSYIVVHLLTGRDIRSMGSGNPGTMNVWECVGLKPALVVAFGDIGKGAAAVGFAYWAGGGEWVPILAGLIAVLGHDFSLFLRFRGGNGTAAAVGACYALVPVATIAAAVGTFVLYRLTHQKRLTGLLGLVSVPFLAYAFEGSTEKTLGIVLLLLVVAAKIVKFEGFTPARSRPPR